MKIDTIKNLYGQNIFKFMDMVHEGNIKEEIKYLRYCNKILDERNPFESCAPMKDVMMIYLQKQLNLLSIKYLKDENLESFKNEIEKLNDATNELINQGLL